MQLKTAVTAIYLRATLKWTLPGQEEQMHYLALGAYHTEEGEELCFFTGFLNFGPEPGKGQLDGVEMYRNQVLAEISVGMRLRGPELLKVEQIVAGYRNEECGAIAFDRGYVLPTDIIL